MKAIKHILLTLSFIVLIVTIAPLEAVHAAEGTCPPIQITNNSFDDWESQTDGNYVVWYGYDGNDNEIYLYDIANPGTPINISQNDGNPDEYPQIEGNYIVWTGYDGNDNEIYLYDISTPAVPPIKISQNDGIDDYAPQIDGNYVVWHRSDEIYLYDISTPAVPPQNISDNSITDSNSQISGSYVVWMAYADNDGEIYLYDISTPAVPPKNISNNPGTNNMNDDLLPEIDGNYIVWFRGNSDTWEIYLYDINGPGTPLNISQNDGIDDLVPEINGDDIAWHTNYTIGANTYDEVYLFSISTDTKTKISQHINSNDVNIDSAPQIDGNYVVWFTYEADYEVYLYDIANPAAPVQISTGSAVYPSIANNYISWTQNDGNDWEIYLYDISCEPLTINEQELYAVIESQLTNNESIDNSIDFILVNIMPPQSNAPGGMNLTIRLNDGRTGHVFVSMIADNGLIKIQIADATPNDTDPPGQIAFRQAVNSELPTILANALNTLLGDYSEIVSLTMTNDALIIEVR